MSSRGVVRLIHWHAAEAAERADRLRAAGWEVVAEVPQGGSGVRAWVGETVLAAIVIDLGRLPSQGRDVALALRQYRPTRRVPLVFVGGAPEKIARVRRSLPDAVYSAWDDIGPALDRAVAEPPVDPVVPRSNLDGYSGTPLPKKLGLKPGGCLGLVAAPDGFETRLDPLPAGSVVRRDPDPPCPVTVWFATSRGEVERGLDAMAACAQAGCLWIAWPKKSSGMVTDLGEPVVRSLGLAAGLVDSKVCAIDATWSGLRFTRRKEAGGSSPPAAGGGR